MNAPAPVTQHSNLKDRLEAALNSGASPEALMAEIASACAASGNAAWEALALIDQHYRKKHLTQDVYRSLKTQTERLALGRAMHADAPATGAAPSAAPSAPSSTPSSTARGTAPAARRAPPTSPPPAMPTRSRPKPVDTRIVGERTQSDRPSVPLLEDEDLARTGTHATGAHITPTSPPRTGQLIRGRYRLEARLDYGGGVVFQALDEFRKDLPEDEQRVAIRFPDDEAEAQREFFRAQHLAHPNIARLIEFDRDDGTAFYTMELLHGRLLRDVLKQAAHLPLPQPEALGIIRDIGAALAHAHARHVVHGHLDSASVLISQNGIVQVLNFGLPRTDGAWTEAREDLSALCLIAYELLAGFKPFDGRTLFEARDRRVRLRRPPGLQTNQWRALKDGLSYTDKSRALSVEQWLAELDVRSAPARRSAPEALIQAQPPRRWPKPLLLLGTLAVLAAAVAMPAYKYWTSHRQDATAALLNGGGAAPGDVAAASAMSASTSTSAPELPSAASSASGHTAPSASAATAPAAGPEPAAGTAARLEPNTGTEATNAGASGVAAMRDEPATTGTGAAAVESRPATLNTPAAPVASATPSTTATDAAAGDGGAGLLGFQAESFTVAPGESAARIPVRRTGGTRGDVGVVWTTEDGSAHGGEDFVSFGRQHETITGGQKSVTLYIPLSADSARDVQSDFYVTLSDASGGAKLGRITRLRVIIAADAQ